MKQTAAFTRKEFMQLKRTKMLTLLIILYVIIGIMSPAIAKLTPWMFEMLGDEMEQQGIIIKQMEITALDSWAQFYKNCFLTLVIIGVVFSGIFTNEYQKGTLIQMLTKGMSRWKVLASKTAAMLITWSICYWITFGVTYAYTVYFWDNSIASHTIFGGICIWISGLWLISLIDLYSALLRTGTAVMLSCAGTFAASYVFAFIPKISEFLPTYLLGAGNMINSQAETDPFVRASAVVLVLSVINVIISIIFFNKRKL
ncbi:MAG: ABC transporter permease subunit [Oscillospiraceae bacterium]|nr:ABC transporter permease subunit [Oscillospiraceae bacterium]